ncbi:aldehyde dehydrogenase family protein [soil metagenome]
MPRHLSHFIAGDFSSTSGDLISLNPTNPSEVLAQFGPAAKGDVDRAVEAAKSAQNSWANVPGAAKAEAFYAWAEAIAARKAELTEAIVKEVGKPIGEAGGEVGRCIAILRYFAGECVREEGSVIPSLAPGTLQYSIRRPLGVVGLITPWNFPLAIPLWKAAPALACGNAVVLKPAEEAALCGHLLAETAAGLPKGLFNVLFGEGETGAAIVGHEGIDAVSFTGSAVVGSKVAQACSARNVKFQTEMGGKNPAIVLKDADLSQAAKLVAAGAMRFAGQKCTATSRVIVDKSIQNEFLPLLKAAIDELPILDPSDAKSAIGPVITEESKVRISEATRDLETIYNSANIPDSGYFLPCQVIEATTEKRVAQEELFGPVLALLVANDLDHALSIANDSPFGLSASLFTTNLKEAMKYVSKIQAGMVRVNADTTGVDPHAPFGGVKGSSSHSREQGPVAKDFFSEIQTVQIS